jgi:DNA-binding MarR family transcriptional regulator
MSLSHHLGDRALGGKEDAVQPVPELTVVTDGGADDELPARLRLVVTRLARRLRQEGGAGLTPSQTAGLASIERHGPLTPSALATIERIQRPSATRMLKTLEANGLVVREGDPDDGRVSRVRVSADGRRLLARIRTRKTAYLAKKLRRLTPEERAVLAEAAAILERLNDEG